MAEHVSLLQLNSADREQFVRLLGEIFEHSPWIPRRTWDSRPFDSVSHLHEKLVAVVNASSVEEQMGLLTAHPELAGKEAKDGVLTDSSTIEQQSAGLSSLSDDEMSEMDVINAMYREKFGFPFIIAVLDNTKADIFKKWRQRLTNEKETEFTTCLDQIYLIAKLRLTTLTSESIH